MSIADYMRILSVGRHATRITETAQRAEQHVTTEIANHKLQTMEYRLEEAHSQLQQLRNEDRGWESLTGGSEPMSMSHEQLVQEANLVRAFSTMNPLMKRGKTIRAGYVFSGGVKIMGRDNGKTVGHQNIEAVIRDLVEDERNEEAVFGSSANEFIENDLFDDGNVFLGHWVNPLTGKIQVRQIRFDEVTRIYKKPGDSMVPWFYLREWTEHDPQTNQSIQKRAWYPHMRYQPFEQHKTLEGHPILWPGNDYPGYGSGAGIYHIKVNPVGRDRTWGIGDGYAAMPWAKAYKEFLEDWADLMKSLSRISWHFQDGGNQAQLQQAAYAAQYGGAGGTSYGTMEVKAPSTQGARFDANSGRPVASMIGAALGLQVTVLTSDPGPDGSRAVAETLDEPQQQMFAARQQLHTDYYRTVCEYAIEQAAIAPQGPLQASVVRDGNRVRVEFRDDTDPSIEVTMPELENVDTQKLVATVAAADATGKMPPKETLRLLLRALQYEDIAHIMDEHTDDEGNWIDPNTVAADSAGRYAANMLRRGGNPADIL